MLLDDRDVRPGVMFADNDLLGIPHQLVIGSKGLEKGIAEYRQRSTGDSEEVPLDAIENFIAARLDIASH